MENELQFKTIKVSQKGQIAIPADMQRKLGIKKGDEILLIRKGKRLMMEKPIKIAKKLGDEFADIEAISESSLKKLWLNKKDDIWNKYLKTA